MSGRLITLEGGEGAGKSTQLATVEHCARERGVEVVTTREPGGTALGEDVRALLMTDYVPVMPPMSELMLIFAARAAHLAQVIEPAIARGCWVVCDRFTDASFAYQGAAGGLGHDTVAALERLVQGERRPDRVLVFDIPVDTGLDRTRARAHQNRFDRRDRAFHDVVRKAYLDRAAADPDRYRVIDAGAHVPDVAAAVVAALRDLT